jgi:hypothetical protein
MLIVSSAAAIESQAKRVSGADGFADSVMEPPGIHFNPDWFIQAGFMHADLGQCALVWEAIQGRGL